MKLILNGTPFEFSGSLLIELLDQVAPQTPFAVAINTVFITKSAYATTVLHENDVLDIVHPVAGG
ncbi:MAG: sulfur carrier protein ThiS [Alysiella sp.]|uniref:sulfur carrier protein ThiS n=1 Tax=Alysiella sp. TaxID=1872483 RepID=UPI0026DA9D04|nr:sulfur carrier protein ThiS [Alysiella sp.]MDO4433376.1 sulfur carrier protein ThiS [Alysiella sp.]